MIPCHLEGPFNATAKELADAFAFLGGSPVEVPKKRFSFPPLFGGIGAGGSGAVSDIKEDDLNILNNLNNLLSSSGTLY